MSSRIIRRITRRGRLSPAFIVASLALFVGLGGVGYAAATIGSAQIKNNSVQGKDIKNSTVQGKDIKNGTIKSGDISKGTRDALKGQTGSAGTPGTPGTPGSPGAPGSAKAYGTVSATAVETKTINVTSVTASGLHVALYCVDTAVPVQNVVVSAQAGTATTGAVVGYGTTLDCPVATDFFVRTIKPDGSVLAGPFTFAAN